MVNALPPIQYLRIMQNPQSKAFRQPIKAKVECLKFEFQERKSSTVCWLSHALRTQTNVNYYVGNNSFESGWQSNSSTTTSNLTSDRIVWHHEKSAIMRVYQPALMSGLPLGPGFLVTSLRLIYATNRLALLPDFQRIKRASFV